MTTNSPIPSIELQDEPMNYKLSGQEPNSITNHDCATRPGSTQLDIQASQAHVGSRKISDQFDFLATPESHGSQIGSCTAFNFDMNALEVQKEMTIIEPPTEGEIKQERVVNDWILLNPGITKSNFYHAWIFIMYFGAILISFSTLEPEYISQTFNVKPENLGNTTALLYLIDYSTRLCFALIWGPIIDLKGRKFVMTIGIILISIGYALIPFCKSSLFGGYIIGKSFLSAGLIAVSMLPFSADYVDNSTKGVLTGANYGMGFVGGAISGVFMKAFIYIGLSYDQIYWVYSVVLLVFGFSVRHGVKGGNTYYRIQKTQDQLIQQQKENFSKWKEIKKAYKEIPWISIGVIFGVLGNTDFYIMTTGLMVWLKSLLPAGQDPTAIATTYQVLFFGLSVVTTMTAALKIDKVPHMRVIFPVLIIASIGFSLFPFIDDPKSSLVYLFFIIEGCSLPGVFVFATYLAIRYNPPEIRGTLSGIGNSIGFLGAIFILSLGGYLHDVWRTDASFILYGSLLFATLFLVSIIYTKTMTNAANAAAASPEVSPEDAQTNA